MMWKQAQAEFSSTMQQREKYKEWGKDWEGLASDGVSTMAELALPDTAEVF